ncbi:class II fructose-1,6-bisphosphate aldolase [uncultured Anaerococcus sp.]|uniref:class II fructose-1,6-bisphosphate aldolase n=1 Tax=uncultured Anaerococcus sp. TaxID=293428 RepID=UPI0025D4DBAF|nr:class II fructose-1,6-bisphosphate aldolase [uncultured Anaerococcus sp.]
MLVNAKEMLDLAYKNGYAIGHFNTNNLEWTKAILLAAEEKKTAVIIAASEGASKYMGGFKTVADLVRNLHDNLNITVPVAIHLDHGSYEGAKACIEAGFTSVMFDGSSFPIEENLEKTKEIVKLAHEKGISVEGEVGGIGGEEDGMTSAGELADVEECKNLAACGIDFLAAGIGNIHGVYPADWQGLNFDRLQEISDAVNMPIVLHGGTGIPDDQVKKAISMGVSKINVNTECQIEFAETTRKYIEEGKDKEGKGFDPRKLLLPGTNAVQAKVEEKIDMFGSENSANK